MIYPHGRETHHAGRILVADSDALLRDVLSQDLTDLGYDVECVPSARAALRALAKSSFDVTLVGARLTEPGTRAVVAAGRAWQPGLQYVVLVPFADGPKLGAAMALQPFACLRIPFSSEDLESVVDLATRRAIVSEPARVIPGMETAAVAVDSITPHGARVREKV